MGSHDDWSFDLGDLLGFDWWGRDWSRKQRRRKRRQPMFEAGEIKFVILRLLREKPRHGYDVIKELEERFAGCYTPSAGTIYPTLQLLEDQGYVKSVEHEGKRVYSITAEGEAFLEENAETLDGILERVRDTIRGFAGGRMGELNSTFAKLASVTFRRAWRYGPDHPSLERVIEVLRRATDEVERAWDLA